jgi:hypothetical protein
MIVLDPGHHYEFQSLDGYYVQQLQFVKRKGEKYPGNLDAYPGTTSQEVLRALCERAFYVNQQLPCWQTKLSRWLMIICIWLYEHRAAKRHGRRVPSVERALFGGVCKHCGHVGCLGRCR